MSKKTRRVKNKEPCAPFFASRLECLEVYWVYVATFYEFNPVGTMPVSFSEFYLLEWQDSHLKKKYLKLKKRYYKLIEKFKEDM